MTAWQPVVADPARRARIATAVRQLVGAADAAAIDDADVDALCDRAVLHAYVDAAGLGSHDHAPSPLLAAVDALPRLGSPCLFGGVARLGWTLAHLADGDDVDAVCATIDAALMRALDDDWPRGYELLYGHVGVGIYALERGDAGVALAARVVDVLGERVARGGWRTAVTEMPLEQREAWPHGYHNLGVAHGATAAAAFLGRCCERGIAAARSLLDGAVAHVEAAPRPGGWYPAWFVDGAELQRFDRLAWCYGDLGMALALHAGGAVDARARQLGRTLARECARRACAPTEAGLCHGSAGIAHLFGRAWHASGDAELRDAAVTWVDRTLAQIDGVVWQQHDLLTGSTGVALALCAAVADDDPAWDRLLAIS